MTKLKVLCSLFAGVFLLTCSTEEPYDGKEFSAGMELFNTEAFAEALPHFKTHSEKSPTDTFGWYYLGMTYHSLDSFDQAIVGYTKTLELFPKFGSAMRNRAVCFMALTDPDKAAADLDAIVAISPDSVYTTDYYYKARCMMAKGDKDAAYDQIFIGMKLDTDEMYSDLFFSFINGNFSEEYLQKRYYEERGMTAKYTLDADGVRNGTWESFYDDGKKYEAGTYVNGKRDGKEMSWNRDGVKVSEATYKNGRLNGLRTTWHDNKKISSKATYEDDQRQGWACSWYPNGGPLGAFYFIDSQRDSIAGRWYEDGKLAEQIHYKEGVQHGEAIIWNLEKDAYMKVLFDNGSPIKEEILEKVPKGLMKFPCR